MPHVISHTVIKQAHQGGRIRRRQSQPMIVYPEDDDDEDDGEDEVEVTGEIFGVR